MKVLVCGDRDWDSYAEIDFDLDALAEIYGYDNIVVIEGGCRGADTFALRWAQKRGVDYKDMPADWDNLGDAAGPIRNRQMLDEEPHLVLAFHSNLSKSKGTLDCVMEANRRGIRVEIISCQR